MIPGALLCTICGILVCSQAESLSQLDYLRARYEKLGAPEFAGRQSRSLLQQPIFTSIFADKCAATINSSITVVVPAGKHSAQPPGPHSTAWLEGLGLQVLQYQFRDPSASNFYSNIGNEAGAYLQYILDHYECLPQVSAFIHGHQHAKHSVNMQQMLKRLRWENVQGYHDVNRVMDVWDAPLAALTDAPNATVLASGWDAYNGTFESHQIWKGKAYDSWQMYVHHQMLANVKTWDRCLGPAGLGPLPERISYVCCSQFVVDRATIMRRPKAFYQAAMEYLQNNTLHGFRHVDKNFILGDVFTIMWPVIFGGTAQYQPVPLCDLYQCA